jgi:hypothetical protein
MIKKFIEVNRVREKLMTLMVSNIVLSGYPLLQQSKEEVFRHINEDDFCRHIADVYGKYFNADDILDMIQFYKSEPGQKMVSNYSELMADVIDEAYQYSAKVAAQMITAQEEEEGSGI